VIAALARGSHWQGGFGQAERPLHPWARPRERALSVSGTAGSPTQAP